MAARPSSASIVFVLFAFASVVVGCGSDGEVADDVSTTPAPTTAESTTTSAVETTTTEPAETTTTAAESTVPVPEALQEFGYPVSDEWVIETVVADIDIGTGGLAIDAEGVIYVGDFGQPETAGDKVITIQPDGSVDTYASAEGMRQLTSTSFGDDGLLYQSAYGSDEVYVIDGDGTATLLTETIRSPTGLVTSGDDSIYVASYSTGQIFEVLPDGTAEEWVKSRSFNGINSLSRGPDGTIYTADHRGSSVFSVTPDGEVTELHDFPLNTSHVTYHDGSLFVTSRTGYVVFRYDLDSGAVEIIAGNGEPGDQDGRGTDSSFGSPNAIRVGPDGALYMNHGDGPNAFPTTVRRLTHQPQG